MGSLETAPHPCALNTRSGFKRVGSLKSVQGSCFGAVPKHFAASCLVALFRGSAWQCPLFPLILPDLLLEDCVLLLLGVHVYHQRSLHSAPTFRLLLYVAVNGINVSQAILAELQAPTAGLCARIMEGSLHQLGNAGGNTVDSHCLRQKPTYRHRTRTSTCCQYVLGTIFALYTRFYLQRGYPTCQHSRQESLWKYSGTRCNLEATLFPMSG